MGPSDTWKDIYYTIKARQYTEPGSAQIAEILHFYQSRKIVFFDNFASGQSLFEPRFFVNAMAYFHLGPYTPFVVMPVFLLGGAVLLRSMFSRLESSRRRGAGGQGRPVSAPVRVGLFSSGDRRRRFPDMRHPEPLLSGDWLRGLGPGHSRRDHRPALDRACALAFFASGKCFARVGGPHRSCARWRRPCCSWRRCSCCARFPFTSFPLMHMLARPSLCPSCRLPSPVSSPWRWRRCATAGPRR